MATTKRVSNERGRRGRHDSTGVVPPRRPLSGERRALMRADAILRCVAFALEYDDWRSDEPDYAEAIAVARDLISRAAERLELSCDLWTAGPVHSDSDGST